LIARKRGRSYRTSREEEETFEERVARVRREMEEVRIEMIKEKRLAQEVDQWERFIAEVGGTAATNLSARVAKLESSPVPELQQVHSIT
jgi:hypothetical protein